MHNCFKASAVIPRKRNNNVRCSIVQTQQHNVDGRMDLSVDTATVIAELLALLAEVLWMHLALVRHIQSIWFLQRTLQHHHNSTMLTNEHRANQSYIKYSTNKYQYQYQYCA